MSDTLVVTPELLNSLEAEANRSKTRQMIAQKAGDQASILGTTADATQLLLYAVASLVVRIATATNIAEMRAAAAPFAPLSTAFLAKVDAGSVKLPFMTKGLDAVVSDIEGRATAVADALASVNAPELNQLDLG
jgi:hypothetical protein